ncbi:MAG: c-type cytochrome [Terrimonas sp.]|nr:c-type cytochrome [Terrimonas sp.]OJY81534.1 MAG: cytochrome C [Sphingobacteriales bacterium 40-81]
MSYHLRTVKKVFSRSAFVFLFSFLVVSANAQDGKAIFNQKCATCHSLDKKLTGPALRGFEERGPWSDRKKLYAWIHNPAGFMASDSYTQGLKNEYNGIVMTGFADLTEAQIDAIVTYINTPPPASTTPGDTPNGVVKAPESDNTLLFGVLTLILAVVALTLLQVNSNLRKMSDDKEGIPAQEPVPFWRNKVYIAMGIIVLFLVGGYYTIQGAVGLGRQQNYEPEQPIYYSHKVHAGINQISCLYCHTGAQEGKQALIPSVNVCMNCHMAINTYEKGPKLVKADGTEVNGTAEIKKLYSYAGWDETAQKYTGKGKPIEWVRIHNLPDHVYFNHSQHVVVGQQQCQTCHGNITEMDEVKQFADLSMGWCINCHRTTKVQFKDNKFYSIYEKFHEDIRNKKIDSVTVEMIGGLECQKCHY